MANLGKIAGDGDPNAAVLPAQVKAFGRSLGILQIASPKANRKRK